MAIVYLRLQISDLSTGTARALHDHYVTKYHLEGLCCSWSMDWVKKSLAKANLLNQTTYENKARIKKIAKRHRLQAAGGVDAVATAYGLRLGQRSYYWYKDRFGDETETGAASAASYYYFSIASDADQGHGFAMYSGAPLVLADSYSGVYQCTGGTCVEVARDHSAGVFRNLKSVEGYSLILR